MQVRYTRLPTALALVGYALLVAVMGSNFYSAWHPWMMACGGVGNYCGGSYAAPNPYPIQAVFLALVASVLLLASWSLIDWTRDKGARASRPFSRTGAALVLGIEGVWLLAFVAVWKPLEWSWTESNRGVIDAVFFASLVLVPIASAFAGSVLSWDAARQILRSGSPR